MRALPSLASVVLALGLALPARAQLMPPQRGPLGTIGLMFAAGRQSGDTAWRTGIGAEGTLQFPLPITREFPVLLGIWATYQGVEAFSGTRYGGGGRLQVAFVELNAGYARQLGADRRIDTNYFVLQPGLQFGPGAVGFRWSFPLNQGTPTGPTYQKEFAVVISIRLPLLGAGKSDEPRPSDWVEDPPPP